jgi:hypothetical protein
MSDYDVMQDPVLAKYYKDKKDNGFDVTQDPVLAKYFPKKQAVPEQPQAQPLDVNRDTSALNLGQRFLKSFKTGDEGKMNYLKSIYGNDNVRPDPQDKSTFIVRDPKTNKWQTTDPGGVGSGHFWSDLPGDVADVGGDLASGIASQPIAAVGAGLGSLLPFPGGAALGFAGGEALAGAVGSVGKQAVGHYAVPGKENATTKERLTEVALGAGGNVLGAGIGKGFGALINKFRPQKLLQEELQSGIKQATETSYKEPVDQGFNMVDEALAGGRGGKQFDFAPNVQKRLDLEKRISEVNGEPFNFSGSQIAGDPASLARARMLAQHPKTQNLVAGFDLERSMDLAKFTNKTFDQALALPPDEAGKILGNAVEQQISNLKNARSAAAKPLYDAIDGLAGGQPVFSYRNFIETIDKEIASNKTLGAESVSKPTINALNSAKEEVLKRIESAGGNIDSPIATATEMLNTIKKYGKAAKGSESVFKDMDTAESRRISGQLYGALNKDMEESALNSNDSSIADAINTARQTYAEHSAAIDDVRTNLAEKILKQSGNKSENIEKSIQDLASPSTSTDQVKKVMSMIKAVDPEKHDIVRASILGEILTKAEPSPSSFAGKEGMAYSDAKLASVLNNDKLKRKLYTLYSDQPNIKQNVEDIINASGILTNMGRQFGSQTAEQSSIWGTGSIKAIADKVRAVVTTSPEEQAMILNNKPARDALLGLVNKKGVIDYGLMLNENFLRQFTRILTLSRENTIGNQEQPQ